MKHLATIFLALSLTACAGSFSSPEKSVFQTRSGYVTLLTAAVQYESLPRCPAEPVCSDPDVVDIMRKADLTAKSALDAAENTVRNHPEINGEFAVAAAQNAVEAMRQILVTYKLLGN